MEDMELYSILEEKLTECWAAYEERLLALPPSQIIGKAAEITAARFCYDELVENGANYPEQYLEHLLAFNDPLEILREQWMDEQCMDQSPEMEHALWSLWDHGPRPDDALSMGGMT